MMEVPPNPSISGRWGKTQSAIGPIKYVYGDSRADGVLRRARVADATSTPNMVKLDATAVETSHPPFTFWTNCLSSLRPKCEDWPQSGTPGSRLYRDLRFEDSYEDHSFRELLDENFSGPFQ